MWRLVGTIFHARFAAREYDRCKICMKANCQHANCAQKWRVIAMSKRRRKYAGSNRCASCDGYGEKPDLETGELKPCPFCPHSNGKPWESDFLPDWKDLLERERYN